MMANLGDRSEVIYTIALILYLVGCFYRCRLRQCRRRNDLSFQNILARRNNRREVEDDRRQYIKDRVIIKKAESLQGFSDIECGGKDLDDPSVPDDDKEARQDDSKLSLSRLDDDIMDSVRKLACEIRESMMKMSSREEAEAQHIEEIEEGGKENSCPICFEEYSVGDEICISRNESCPHQFHFECLQSWLLKHDDCPLCRANYLNNALDEENESLRNTTQEEVVS